MWLPLQIFGICLAQNLVSDVKAVKANWWQERWREGVSPLSPTQGQHSTQTIPSSRGWRAKNIQLCLLYHWAKHHIHCLTLADKQILRVCLTVYQWHFNGEKIKSTETKQLIFCLPMSWDLNPKIQRTILISVSCDSVLWTIVFMGHGCTQTPVSWEVGNHGWKYKKTTK